jgi:hypothetical protein
METIDATAKSRKTRRACSICSHPRRDEIDRDLVMGRRTQSEVARQIGCHQTSVSRHVRNHLLPRVHRQALSDTDLADFDVLTELKQLYIQMKNHLQRAEEADNWHAIRALHSEARRDLELLAKLVGQLDEGAVANLAISPQWLEVRAVVLTSLAPYPEARRVVAQALERIGDDGHQSD